MAKRINFSDLQKGGATEAQESTTRRSFSSLTYSGKEKAPTPQVEEPQPAQEAYTKPTNSGYASVADLNRSTNGSGAKPTVAESATVTPRANRSGRDGNRNDRNDRGEMLAEAREKSGFTPDNTLDNMASALWNDAKSVAADIGGTMLDLGNRLDYAASGDRQRIENARHNLETYAARRDAATTPEERERWQRLADAAQRQIDSYTELANIKGADTAQGAQKLYDASNVLYQNALRAQAEAEKGKSDAGRLAVRGGLLLGNIGTQVAADLALPGLGTALRIADVAGRAARDYRQQAGENYNPVVAGVRGLAGGVGVAAGSALSRSIGRAGSAVLQSQGMSGEIIPRIGMGAASGLGYALGEIPITEIAAALTDPNYTPDEQAINKRIGSAVAFGALSQFLAGITQKFRADEYTVAEPKHKMKWFSEDMTPEDAAKLRRLLARQYHPDAGGNAAIMQEINDEYSRFLQNFANRANAAYNSASNAAAAGDGATYEAASAEYREAIGFLREAVADGAITGEAAEAVGVLSTIADTGIPSAAEETPTPATPPAPLSEAAPEAPTEGNLTAPEIEGVEAQKTGNPATPPLQAEPPRGTIEKEERPAKAEKQNWENVINDDRIPSMSKGEMQAVNDIFEKSGERSKVVDKPVNQPAAEAVKPKTQESERIAEVSSNPQQQIADDVRRSIEKGVAFNSARLFEIADKAYGGTMAEGAYTVKDAYDGMELAVNQYLMADRSIRESANGNALAAQNTLKQLQELLTRLPTQTKRSEEQESFQQFSTPPNIAYLAAWTANIGKGDVVLEPSAGIGGLALWPKAWGATVYGNELSERRLAFLNQLGLDGTFNLNAEQINNLLPDEIKPTAILMNPPFSSTAGRTTTNKTANAKRHIEQALDRLEDNGRLVAILGNGMSDDAKAFRKWWDDLREEYSIRANIRIDGENYKKYGTTFDVQLVVIDKTGPQMGKTITGEYKDLAEIPNLLEGIRNDRARVEQNAVVAGVQKAPEKPVTKQPVSSASTPTGAGAESTGLDAQHKPASAGVLAGNGGNAGSVDVPHKAGRSISSADNERGSGRRNERRGAPSRNAERDGARGQTTDAVGLGNGQSGGERIQLERSGADKGLNRTAKEAAEHPDSIYSTYVPRKARVKGSKPHPAKLVESAAMAAVEPPDVTYTPNLPENIVKNGILSDAQLENVIYAGQAHEQKLPSGLRKGFFIGDGTGVGKGRQISGIIMDNFRQGRTKAIWISEKAALINDAKRDWTALGGNEDEVLDLKKFKYKQGEKITADRGIVFSSYDTLKTDKDARIRLLTEWLGKDFDGVIALDEAHNMGNANGKKGVRGRTKPSAKALAGIDLQNTFPNARVVYASATGATEASNYAYLQRLGLWGKGTAFNDFNDFMTKISNGGLAAMELVARDMKAMGEYMARSISYDDVTYDVLQHDLTPMQTEIYNTMSRAWQKVLQNVNEALEITGQQSDGMARGRAMSQIFGTQQRFYNQILTSMSMPTVIADMKKELANGRSCVLQLVNTNAAAADRAIAKNADEGGDLDDLDLTPSDMLIQMVQKAFPVELYEEYDDEEGRRRSRPVLDGEGKPVIDKKAVKMRDALIDDLKMMKVPDGPLEMLFDAFGEENVAEVTGRTRRVVEKLDETGGRKRVIERRSNNSGIADANMFQDGKKRILVFSDAGGTGRSYHADLTAKNQQQRVHYLLQPGWEASKAVQGFGRTHRSNQASAPIFRLITTNVMGQKRFTSTIARRLDQLGALTKGQRQAGSGVFGEKDNLENPIAEDALSRYYRTINPETLKRLGLYDKIYDEFGKFNDKSDALRDMGKFLNRILSLEVDEQNEIFQGFYDTFERFMSQAIASGTVDMGLENYRADKIEVVDEKVVRTDATGADTKYVQMTAYRKPVITPFSKVTEAHQNFQGIVRLDDGSVRAVYEISSVTNLDTGEVQRRYKLESPVKDKFSTFVEATLKKQTKPIPKNEWSTAWKEEIAKVPEYNTSTLHLLTGTLLPIWDRLPQDNTRVMRVLSSDGRQYLGRVIRPDQIDGVLRGLGANRTVKQYSGQEVRDAVLNEGKEATFSRDRLKLTRRRVSGEWRMELTGPNVWYIGRQYSGIITEKINFNYRYFIPTNAAGTAILNEIMQSNPVIDLHDAAPEDVDALERTNTFGAPVGQEISSAGTSLNQVPALHKDPRVEWGKVNIDIGGRRFDAATEYLKEKGVQNLVFDPYNRPERINADTLNFLRGGYRADTATCANVLNVIAERDARLNVILEMAKAIKPDGIAYFMVYEGKGDGIGKTTNTAGTISWQNNRKTSEYVNEIETYFKNVTRKGKLIIAKNPKDRLPKAMWEVQPGNAVEYSRSSVSHSDQWTSTRIEGGEASARGLSEIIERIRHDLGVNITTGHVRGAGKRGQYDRRTNGVRSKIANDLPTISHEIGHHFDNMYGLRDHLSPQLVGELRDGLSDEMRAAYPEKRWTTEGIAEYFRKYLQNRETAAIDYPAFTAYVKGLMTGKDAALLDQIADAVNAYFSLDADTATSSIRMREEGRPDARTTSEKIRTKYDALYQQWVDSNHGIKLYARDTGDEKSYKLATNAAYADAMAGAIITGDLTDANGQYVGPGLGAVLHGINLKDKNEYRLFGEYLTVKHGPERLAEGMRIFADDRKNSTAWMNRRQKELEDQYPEFSAASDRLYQFIGDLYKTWGVDTGLIGAETLAEWRERWSYYVPLNRAVSIEARGIGARRGFANQNSTVKRAHGSGLDIVHPVDNIINNLVLLVNAGVRNNVMRSITDAAEKYGADASLLEKVPVPLKKTFFDATGLKHDLAEAFFDSNMTEEDRLFALDTIGNIQNVLEQYGKGKAHGDVITVMKDGNQQFWKINDPLLLSSISNMNPQRLPAFLQAYGAVTRFMTSAITGNDAIWGLFSNFPRDLQTMLHYSDDKNVFKLLARVGSAYVNRFRSYDRLDPLYKEYLAMGGGQTSVYTADRDLAKRARAKLAGDKMQWLDPVEWLSYISETVELGPRYATYRICREKGMTPQEAFYASLEITVNFRRAGIEARTMNKVVPYFNAGVQGLDRFARWTTAEDAPRSGRSKAALLRLIGYITSQAAAGALMYAVNNYNEEAKKNYQQLSNYTKNSYWLIPLGGGKYFAIPKARELSTLASLFETMAEYFIGDNKHAFDEFWSYAADTFLPPLISDIVSIPEVGFEKAMYGAMSSLGILGVIGSVIANRDYLGRPIVSASMQYLEPRDQYNARTSKLAKALGAALNASPMKIDYFFQQVLGGYWKYQRALFPVGSENMDLTLGVQNRYIKDNQYSTDLTNWLYDKAAASAAAAKSDPGNIKKNITSKMDGKMTDFYGTYNKLSKNSSDTEAARGTRQIVLNMILEYQKAADNNFVSETESMIYSVVENENDTSLLPATMDSSVKDGSGEKHLLSAIQYVEYQTDYLRQYYEYVETALPNAKDDREQVAILKAAKEMAKTKATDRVLKRIGAPTGDAVSKFGTVDDTNVILFKAALDLANDDGSLKQQEVIDAIDALDLTRKQSSTLFHTRYDSDKNNPYK